MNNAGEEGQHCVRSPGCVHTFANSLCGKIEQVCTFFVPLSAKQFLTNKFKFESISRSVCVGGSLLQAEVTFTDLLDGLLLHCCTEMNGSQGMCNVIIQAPPTPTTSSQRITFYIWGLQ